MGILYEGDGYATINFMQFALEYLTDGGETSASEPPCLEPTCPADLTSDGQVDGADLTMLLGGWGACPDEGPCIDLDGNGIVNGADLTILLAAWGACP